MAQWRPRVHPELAGETWAPADASASTARNIRNDPGIGASWSDRYLPSPAHFAPKSGLFATKDVQSADILGFRHRASSKKLHYGMMYLMGKCRWYHQNQMLGKLQDQ